jgi:hypothetical protein
MRQKRDSGSRQPFVLKMPRRLHRELRLFVIGREESLNDLLVRVVEDWWRARPERSIFSRLARETHKGS